MRGSHACTLVVYHLLVPIKGQDLAASRTPPTTRVTTPIKANDRLLQDQTRETTIVGSNSNLSDQGTVLESGTTRMPWASGLEAWKASTAPSAHRRRRSGGVATSGVSATAASPRTPRDALRNVFSFKRYGGHTLRVCIRGGFIHPGQVWIFFLVFK